MARDTTISPSAAGPSVISAEGGVIDVTRLRVALARLSRRLRRHELAGLTPTQLAALATIGKGGPMRLGDVAAGRGVAPPRPHRRAGQHPGYHAAWPGGTGADPGREHAGAGREPGSAHRGPAGCAGRR